MEEATAKNGLRGDRSLVRSFWLLNRGPWLCGQALGGSGDGGSMAQQIGQSLPKVDGFDVSALGVWIVGQNGFERCTLLGAQCVKAEPLQQAFKFVAFGLIHAE
jgi:hypothetical protein